MTRAYLVAGLGYGDEGKGAVVDFLARETRASLVVRYNGGSQAGHNVVTKEGVHHTFSQFGSGTFAGADTYLSRYCLVDPLTFFREAQVLYPKLSRLPAVSVEVSCPIITPIHVEMNRLRERLRAKVHGTCGMGIGEVRMDQTAGDVVLYAGDLRDRNRVRDKLELIAALKRRQLRELTTVQKLTWSLDRSLLDAYSGFASHVRLVPDGALPRIVPQGAVVVFEGAQGVLLDQTFGTQPHTTWTDCTFRNAEVVLGDDSVEKIRIGVIRTYATRHGVGPLFTESPGIAFPEPHNGAQGYQGAFRQGYFNLEEFHRAVGYLGGVDALAVTHMDYTGGQLLTVGDRTPLDALGYPVGIEGWGPSDMSWNTVGAEKMRSGACLVNGGGHGQG